MLSQTQTLNFQAHLFHIPVQNENKLSCVTTRFLWLHYTLYLIFRVSCLHPVYCIPISYLPIIFCEHSYKYSPPLYLSLPPHPTISSFTPYTSLSLSLPISLSPTPSLFPSPYPTLYLPLYPTISLSGYPILLCNNLYVYRGI